MFVCICRSVAVLTECMRNKTVAKFLRERQESLKHSLPLGSYLLKPVQRILKYHLLLHVSTQTPRMTHTDPRHSTPVHKYCPTQMIVALIWDHRCAGVLQEIATHLEKDSEMYDVIQEAIDTMQRVAWHINDMKRKHEHAVRLQVRVTYTHIIYTLCTI